MPQYVADTLSPTVLSIPGSSPFIPLARDHRDAHHSLSMTMANNSEPSFRLSSNRSLASLRSHEYPPRPKSPYMYPTRLRRHGYRPSSPALSDTAGIYPRRRHRYTEHAFPPYPGPMRMRRPSDISMRRPPSRSRTPVYYGNSHPDIPPVPPLMPHRHVALEREREQKLQKSDRSASHRSGKHSISSGSTNRRFDSDVPSSDSTSPPTPRDHDMLTSPTGTQSVPRSLSGIVNYYDYSEQYEDQGSVEPSAATIPTGFVRHIKTIIEERGTSEPALKGNSVSALGQTSSDVDELMPNIPELPASPVPRRITRDLVLAGLRPGSSSGEVETSGATAEIRSTNQPTADIQQEQTAALAEIERRVMQPTHVMEIKNRHSILSQAGSSVMDSSTLEFAVRCSIPIVADKGVTLDIGDETRSVCAPDMDPTSEDGMTDLLEGYQRTESKEGDQGYQGQLYDDEPVEKRSNHAAKSSDEQSFKSCTDAFNVPDVPMEEVDARSSNSCKNMSDRALPSKDYDAKSVALPRNKSVSALNASWAHFSDLEIPKKRPFTEIPSPSPSILDRKPLPSTSDLSISKVVGRLRTNTNLSSTQGSAGGSVSSFKGQGPHTPPAVPLRESGSSKETHQSRSVTNYLLRSVRRFARSSPSSTLKPSKELMTSKPEELEFLNVGAEIPTPPPMKERTLTGNVTVPSGVPLAMLKAPQRALKKEHVLPHRQCETMVCGIGKVPKSDMVPGVATASSVRHLSLGNPSSLIPEASSMYSNSSFTGPCHQASPAVKPQTPQQHRRESQSTTHLSWISGGNAMYPPFIDRPRDARDIQEDSTTDLRLPGSRHAVNPLPDLKEESHEDSSLNTSASNFRPLGSSQPAVHCISTDGVAISRRQPSVRSSGNSVFQQMHLPSMNFSSFGSFDDALERRVSRSLDLVPAVRAELVRMVAPRPASASEDREKYKSVFAGLDTPAKTPVTRQHASDELWMRRTPDLLMREVDSLTIPSVNGLTTRLSEMLPKLKEALGLAQADEFPDEEGIMEKAMEKLNEVGLPAQKRSSARLRPVPGSPNMLVVDDEVFKEIIGPKKENTPAAWSLNRDHRRMGGGNIVAQGVQSFQREAPALIRSGVVARGGTRDATSVNTVELEAPSPSHLLCNNSTTFLPRTFSTPSSQPSTWSPHSRGDTPTATDTRPWNLDKNYPWATDPSVDISLPPPSASKYSPRPGPSHLRNRLSNASTGSTGTSSPYGPTASHPAPQGPTAQYYSLSVEGSRSIEPSVVGFDASGYPIGPVRVRDDDQSHGAGERYPTSALPLPSNLHIYPGQASNFSLETSDDELETTSARKTLFKRRPRRATRTSVNRRDFSQSHIRELQNSQAVGDSSQQQPDCLPNRSRRQTFTDAQGMSKLIYIVTKCRLSAAKGWNKIRDKILCCSDRIESPNESSEEPPEEIPNEAQSVEVTVPEISRASSSTDETQVPDRESPEPTPVIREGPGRRFTPGHLFTFPAFFTTENDGTERASAFQSNTAPPARTRSTAPVDTPGPSKATGHSISN